MHYKSFFHIFLSVFAVSVLVGCTEDIDLSNRYVFKDPIITEYLTKHEQFSEYSKLLKMVPVSNRSKTTVWQLLSARGHYTVFAPTNEAIQKYLEELDAQEDYLTAPSWDAFTDSTRLTEIRNKLVWNSIIDCGDDLQPFYTYDFPTVQDAEFLLENMNERKLTIHHQDEKNGESDMLINGCPVDMKNRDITATNGIVHCVNAVITSSDNILGTWIDETVKKKKEGFYVSAMLVKAVGLVDSLSVIQDDTYEKLEVAGRFDEFNNHPKHRKYGFTFFAESDSLWSEALGKPALEITVDDVVKYLTDIQAYPEAVNDDNYTAENNLLNMFVTYHLLNRRLAKGRLVNHYNEFGYDPRIGELTCAKMQYYYTMGKRRLMKLFESRESHGVYINRCPVLDNGIHGTYHELSCASEAEGVRVNQEETGQENTLLNAIVYPIDRIMVYDQQMRNNLGKERMRFDFASISPELENNDYRMSELMDEKHMSTTVPPDAYYPYFHDIKLNPGTTSMFYATCRMTGNCDFEGDELKFMGYADVILTMPPVPTEDTYQIRYRLSSQTFFGMHQMFFGEDIDHLYAADIPIDLRIPIARYGWEPDTEDDDYNAEVDKRLRNKGFMKGARAHGGTGVPWTITERENDKTLRAILVTAKMSPDKTYYLRMKLCLDYECEMFTDYLELCPKAVYDNPQIPEDQW